MSEHEDMMERLETADTVPLPTPPTPLTREQVEEEAVSLNDLPAYITALKSTITAQRQALAQQAQEVERLKQELGSARDKADFCKAEIDRADALLNQFGIPNIAHECGDMLKPVDERIGLVFVQIDTMKQQLAAMTAERDEAMGHAASMSNDVTHLGERLAASQARCKELEEHERQTHERLGAILGTHDSLEQCAKQLQDTLAERVAEVSGLNLQLRDARQDAARLQTCLIAHMGLAARICYAEPELTEYRTITQEAQRALKGA